MSRTPDDKQDVERSSDEKKRRFFRDDTHWLVHERPAPPLDRRGGVHLIFESLEIMRRVRVFPANWFELSDDDLYAISLDIHER